MKRRFFAVGFGVLLIALWQVLAMHIGASYILPSPYAVAVELIDQWDVIMTVHFPMTMQVVLIGCAVSLALGVFLAVVMDLSPNIERAIYPILTVTQTVPTMCIAPILVLWFGYTPLMRIFVVVLSTFFPLPSTCLTVFARQKRRWTSCSSPMAPPV